MSTTPPLSTTFKNGSERRRLPRYNVAFDVAFGPLGSAGGPPADAQCERTVTINISIGGVCLYSDVLYPIGSQLFCSLSLPGRAQPITAVGALAWFQKVNHETHGYRLGIEFAEISAHDRAALQAILDHPPAAEPSRSKRVLLVDDDEELRLALKVRFESSGFQMTLAGDGLDALRQIRETQPHLIILDLMLPGLNGFEVCRLLKFDQKFRHIPIILLTARSRREDAETGRAVGADAFVTKPFNGTALITKVEELLGAPRG